MYSHFPKKLGCCVKKKQMNSKMQIKTINSKWGIDNTTLKLRHFIKKYMSIFNLMHSKVFLKSWYRAMFTTDLFHIF